MRQNLIIVFFLLTAALYSLDTGSAGLQFLKMETDPRETSLFSSGIAGEKGSSSLSMNPGGIGAGGDISAAFSYQRGLAGADIISASYLQPLGKTGTKAQHGLGIHFSFYDELNQADLTAQGTVTGLPSSYRYYDILIGAGYGLSFDKVSLGTTLDYFASRLYYQNSHGINIRLGSIFEINRIVSLGLTVKNIGGAKQIGWKSLRNPLIVQPGSQFTIPLEKQEILFFFSADIFTDEYPFLNFGAEYSLLDTAFIRLGYRLKTSSLDTPRISDLGIGMGLKLKMFQIDLAWRPASGLGHTIATGLTFELNRIGDK